MSSIPRWSWRDANRNNGPYHRPLDELLRIADKYFDGNVLISRTKKGWMVILGAYAGLPLSWPELEEAPHGGTLIEAVAVALERAAPLSEEQ